MGARIALAAVALPGDRWVLVRAKVDEQLGLTLFVVVVVSCFGLTLAWLVATALWHAQQQQFEELDEATRRSVEIGDISAFARLVPLRADELGRLANNFNRMFDMLDELTAVASAVARGRLDVELERPGELHDAFRGMLEQLNRVVPRIRATAVELASTASEIQAAVHTQDRVGEQQSRSVLALGESVAALSTAASDIAHEAASVLADAEQASQATRETADELASCASTPAGSVGCCRASTSSPTAPTCSRSTVPSRLCGRVSPGVGLRSSRPRCAASPSA